MSCISSGQADTGVAAVPRACLEHLQWIPSVTKIYTMMALEILSFEWQLRSVSDHICF